MSAEKIEKLRELSKLAGEEHDIWLQLVILDTIKKLRKNDELEGVK